MQTRPRFGHNVSHSNRKTNRRFEPNLQQATLYSEGLSRKVSLRVSTRALRTVSRAGGVDLGPPFAFDFDQQRASLDMLRREHAGGTAIVPGHDADIFRRLQATPM